MRSQDIMQGPEWANVRALYKAGGLLTGEILRSALMCYPVMILGIFCGVKLAGVIREQTAKRVITITLILLGLSLLGAALPRIWA